MNVLVRPILPAVLLLSWAASAATVVEAQESQAPDSTGLLDRARDAQARFERLRRRNLPRTRNRGGASCSEVVGRFCLVYEGEEEWVPEPDPPEVLEARQRLLESLADVGRRIPGDRWVLAQRVFYLGEEGRWSEALELADGCGGHRGEWWCHALRGLVHHGAERYPASLGAFRDALDAMEPERAERWNDPEHLLEQGAYEHWSDAEEDEREVLLRRLWLLADPLYLVEGNDRLTAHYARHTISWIREDAANPHRVPWGWDLARILVRYGAELGWERERPAVSSLESASVVGHHHPESRQFLPSSAAFRAPTRLEPGEWTLEADRPRTAYAPAYAARMEDRPFQVARFRREAEMVVVAGFRLPPDTLPDVAGGGPPGPWGGGLQAGLFLVAPDSGVAREVRTRGADSGGLRLRAEAGSYLASVEVWDPGGARAARARQGVRMAEAPGPDVVTISDLLVMDAGAAPPESLEEAAPRTRPELRACPGGTMAVGWELYGLGLRRETLAFRLRVERTDEGFFRRTGELLGLVDSAPTVTLEWSEPGPERLRPFFRAVDVSLPEEMEAGTHELRLRVRLPGREPLAARRPLMVGGEGCDGVGG